MAAAPPGWLGQPASGKEPAEARKSLSHCHTRAWPHDVPRKPSTKPADHSILDFLKMALSPDPSGCPSNEATFKTTASQHINPVNGHSACHPDEVLAGDRLGTQKKKKTMRQKKSLREEKRKERKRGRKKEKRGRKEVWTVKPRKP